jgi:hypothetical protein
LSIAEIADKEPMAQAANGVLCALT